MSLELKEAASNFFIKAHQFKHYKKGTSESREGKKKKKELQKS